MVSDLIFKCAENIKFIYSNAEYKIPERLREYILDNFNNLIKNGKEFTNDKLFVVEKFTKNKDEFIFHVSKSNYAHYLYTKKMNFTGEDICRSLASMALPITLDNYFVLCNMSQNTAFPGIIKFIGGTISQEDLKNGKLDFYHALKREVLEEIGINIETLKVNNISKKYLICRRNMATIGIGYVINLNLTKDELDNEFHNHNLFLERENMFKEISSLKFIKNSPKEIIEFTKENCDNPIEYINDTILVEGGILESNTIFNQDVF